MNIMRRLVLSAALLLTTLSAHAGRDPIGWTMTGAIPPQTQVHHTYSIHFTLTNNLPFTMPTPLKISNGTVPPGESFLSDDCSGLKLAPGASCNVGLRFVPKTDGRKEIGIFMEYGKNKVRIPQPIIISTSSGAASPSVLQGSVLSGFPTAILSSTTYTLNFQFKNTGLTTLSGLVLAVNAANTSGYTQTATTCTTSLTAGQACTVTGTFTTAATSGPVAVGYTMTSGSIQGSVVDSTIISNTSGKAVRVVTFVNSCTQPIWFGAVSGSNVTGCKSTADCPHPSVCNPAAAKGQGQCFYPAPVPADGNFMLSASGGTNTVNITDSGLLYVWSGNFGGRTGCTSGDCTTGDCEGGTGACPTGVGMSQPVSLAEFTMQRNTIDSYDVSILNGTNVGVQILPTTSFTFANAFTPAIYNCGSPGKVAASGTLGGCSWTFDPTAAPTPQPSYRYVYVTPTKVSNTSCAGCSGAAGDVCGLNYSKSAGTLGVYCGTVLGYNTPNQVCSYKNTNLTLPNTNNNAGDIFFNCDAYSGVKSFGDINGTTGSPAVGTQYSLWGLFACPAQNNGDLGTCYNGPGNTPLSTTNCCGCVDWQTYGYGITVPSDTVTCVKNNPVWTSTVLPGVTFIKKGCPTAYSYPFDDKASSFACSDIGASRTQNQVNYTITFCPT